MNDFKLKLKLLGKNVKKLRLEKNLTIKELSKKSGINMQYLKIIENGEAVNVNTNHLDSLCKSLNVKLNDLLDFMN